MEKIKSTKKKKLKMRFDLKVGNLILMRQFFKISFKKDRQNTDLNLI